MIVQKRNPYPANWWDEKSIFGLTRNDVGLAVLGIGIAAGATAANWSWVKFWVFGFQ